MVLDTILCMFSQYCSDKYTVEYCEVVNPNGTSVLYPELEYRTEMISVKKTNKKIGIKLVLFTYHIFFSVFNDELDCSLLEIRGCKFINMSCSSQCIFYNSLYWTRRFLIFRHFCAKYGARC